MTEQAHFHEDWPHVQGLPGGYRPPPRPNWVTMIGVWAAVFLLVWIIFQPRKLTPLHDPRAEPRAVTARGDLAADEEATIEVFREASPSVVYITSTDVARDFFMNVLEIPRGSGSGFIYDSNGHIVTNLHVIVEGRRWTVSLADQSQWEAVFVGAAQDKDLAVLKIDAPPERLKAIAVGASSDLSVGQKVFAIGNPFGLDQTLTTGVVSALGREIQSLTGRPIHDVIQTDAAINPGNSGGPLLDSAGRLIGVNTQIASPSGASAGIGFAIPVDIVNRVVPEIIRYGKVIRPGLGVVVWPDSLTRQLGVEGVLLQDVADDSAAARAGLRGTVRGRDGRVRQVGDLIIKVADQPTPGQYALLDVLERFKVGDEVRVTYKRGDEVHETMVQLQALE